MLGLELSSFNRRIKMKLETNDDHKITVEMSNHLWFRNDEINEETSTRRNAEQMEAQLEALTLWIKLEAYNWLQLTPRDGALGAEAFQRGPPMIAKIHQFLLVSLDQADRRGDKATELMQRMNRKTLEAFWTENVQGRGGHIRTDSLLKWLRACWTASFLAKLYSELSRHVIIEFVRATTKLSIVMILSLFLIFGAEIFQKEHAVLLMEGIQNLCLNGLLTIVVSWTSSLP